MVNPVKKALVKYPECISVGNQSVIPKRRVVGIFSISLSRVKQMVEKLKLENKVIDVSSSYAVKTAIFLDTGQVVLSALTVRVLFNGFKRDTEISGENQTEQDED